MLPAPSYAFTFRLPSQGESTDELPGASMMHFISMSFSPETCQFSAKAFSVSAGFIGKDDFSATALFTAI